MWLSQIKIGEAYQYWGTKVFAEEIEKADWDKGITFSGVICRIGDNGGTMKTAARYMVPWEDYQAEKRLEELEAQRAREQVEKIISLIGEGVEVRGEIRKDYAYLWFTEQAAERLLSICGAKPIPEDRRPSLAKSDQEWIKRATLLGQRIRRALGAGYAGEYGGHMLNKENKRCQAQIFFYNEDLGEVVKRLTGETEPPSSLSELLG